MFWADRIAKEIIDSNQHKPYWVDDMFTPSGFAHIGSLRGPLVHDLIYRALVSAGVDAKYTYVFNDFDPIDGLPPELTEKFTPYLGFPLRTAPSPEEGFESFAHYFSRDFQKVLESLGVGATFLSSWDMYHEGKFNGVIREALDNAEKIQDIYQKVSGSKKREKGWLPLQVVCEKCGKLGTTRVHKWDGKKVEYICEPKMVSWAVGCGYLGQISPFDGHGKLPWKVDWPAHWKVLGVTIEGAGKDHSSAGGSRDIARALCRQVFHIPDPFNLPYEFFLIGGKKMSSSKGLGLKARDLTSVLPASIGRFLFTRTDYRQAIEFDPFETMAIADLFDEYDRCWQAFNRQTDENFTRAFILSQTREIPAKNPQLFIPRFRDVANYLQLPNINLQKKFEEIKKKPLTSEELQILQEREKFARIWLGNYAPSQYRFQMTEKLPPEVAGLGSGEKAYLKEVILLLEKKTNPEDLQLELYHLAKRLGVATKKAFSALYLAVLGKTNGPKAAWFLLQYPKEEIAKRLQKAAEWAGETGGTEKTLQIIQKPDLFTIDPKVQEIYPSVSIGIALIKGVRIDKMHAGLEEEKKELLETLKAMTTKTLGEFPEIIAYRKLYKQMGIDWHSRRPSPEALLRRVILGKGLYTVNTCVDAYNLVVMKHRISVGAFDYDQVKFPTVLRFAGQGDEILLLGDREPTKYTAQELAYYDRTGGYNIDFNFRDAQRTMVTEKTKDVWINVDGILDIGPEMVEKSLRESVESIVKYCGGTVEFEGIVS